ncbi:hypothetical protein [Microbacterium sp. NPDC087665]|uniref:hypothetical protein n=1 Tax=Microbacterium sp. NPDC087665 TaxID=3364194 RepID=UPI0037FDD92A
MLAVIMMTAAGCAPAGAELYQQARDANLTMKQEIAALQLHIFDGEWDVSQYGDIAEACGANGYRFVFGRSTPLDDGWRLPEESTEAKLDALMAWLDEHGWSNIRLLSYSGDVTSTSIEAEKPSAHIDDLLLTFTPGIRNDIVNLGITGTCEPGDKWELRDLMYPDDLENYEERPTEHPSTEPKFGLATPSPTPTP